MRPWSPPGAATTPPRSTTCSPSPECSAGCWMRRAGRSPTTCSSRPPARWRALSHLPNSGRTTSSRRCSTPTSRPPWPRRSATRPGAATTDGPDPGGRRGLWDRQEWGHGGGPGGAAAGSDPPSGGPQLQAHRGAGGGGRAGGGDAGRRLEPADQGAGRAGARAVDGSGERPFRGVPGRAGRTEQRPGPGQRARAGGTGWLAGAPSLGPPVPGRPDRPRHRAAPPPALGAGGTLSSRVSAGYAGEARGQPQGEIDEGAWYVVPAESADVFDPEPQQLWSAVLRRSGGALALVATYPDDPSLN